MKRPGFLEGVIFALLAALPGGALHMALAALFPPGVAARLLIALVALAYLLYLLARSGGRIGRVSTVASWSVLALATWWLAPSVTLYALIHLLVIWLVRALYFHGGVPAALADAALCALGVVLALAALSRTGSVALGLWSFFLIQALFTAIPAGWPGKPPAAGPVADRFEQAHRNAEAALRRLFPSP